MYEQLTEEADMDQGAFRLGWWEVVTVLLAINSVVFGFLFGNADHFGWAIAIGFVPGVLLLVGLALRSANRGLAAVLITGSSIAAAVAWWMIYPVVLALAVIIGGFMTGKIGFGRSDPVAA
jgi:hypothetical protein